MKVSKRGYSRRSPGRSAAARCTTRRSISRRRALTKRPIKFGTITAELLGLALKDTHYKSRRERILAIADALNAELADVVAAGCTVIQLEEPQLHLAPLRGAIDQEITQDFLIEVFNRTVKGLRDEGRGVGP